MSAQLQRADELRSVGRPRATRSPRGARPVDLAEARMPDVCAVPGDPGDTSSAALLDLVAPATGRVLSRVADTDPTVATGAAASTASAARAWGWLSGEDRARHLFAVAGVLAGHARGAALLSTLGTGRPVAATLAPGVLADAAFSAAGWADKLPAVGLRPRCGGVALVAADWRQSSESLATTTLLALAAGTGVVVRARPEVAPLALRLVEAYEGAGLPVGLVTVVPGAYPGTDTALENGADIVAMQLDGPRESLQELATRAARRGLSWSGQADAPAVDLVLPGADLDAVTAAVLTRVQGGAQTQPGGNLVLAHDDLVADLTRRLQTAFDALTPGDPLVPATRLGPCPTPEIARAATATRQRPTAVDVDLSAGGWWASPAVLPLTRRGSADVAGPLVGVRPVADEAAARRSLGAAGSLQVWEHGGSRSGGPGDRLRRAVRWLRTCCG